MAAASREPCRACKRTMLRALTQENRVVPASAEWYQRWSEQIRLALGRIDAHKLCLSEMMVIRSGLPINVLLAVQIRGSIVA
jgi:hypothetical protein